MPAQPPPSPLTGLRNALRPKPTCARTYKRPETFTDHLSTKQWVGVCVTAFLGLSGIIAGGVAGFLALPGVFLLGTGAWHLVRARSWFGQQRRLLVALGMVPALWAASFGGSLTNADAQDGPTSAFTELQTVSPAPADPTEPVATETTSETPTPSVTPPAAPAPNTALAALAKLPVKGRAPKTGYSREQYGPAWADENHNGCDTRNDILGRDLTAKTFKAGTHNCVVLTGVLADPYTGKTINFQRGAKTSSAVQIDHVVALSDSWQKGAQALSLAQRKAFANDPLNLLAVDGPANQQKGDGDAATWLPSHKPFRCQYAARQIAVKTKYALWVTAAERDALARILAPCPQQPLPAGGAPLVPAGNPATVLPEPAETRPKPAAGSVGVPAGGFKNCRQVCAAGKAPLYRGQPGYSSKMDGDGDGIACEVCR